MLFSHPDVAALLNERFVPRWVKVRDVAQVTIDFGEGRVLKRTLQGNIATYICLPDGRVIDVITGLNDAETYLRRLREGLELYAALQKVERDTRAEEAALAKLSRRPWPPARGLGGLQGGLLRYHEAALRQGHQGGLKAIFDRAHPGADYSGNLAGVEARDHLDPRMAISKSRVELPIKRAIDPGIVRRELAHGELDLVDGEGRRLEGDAASLALDAKVNEARRLQVHRLMLLQPLASSQQLTQRVYKEIMHLDISDPFLGLAPQVVGGEGGRSSK